VSEEPSCQSEEWLTRALAGDTAAFGMLVRMHQRSVYSLALRMLSDRQTAEDLAQEVFLQLHRNLATLESAAHLAFWLRKVTLNRSIDRLRREPKIEAVSLEAAEDVICESFRRPHAQCFCYVTRKISTRPRSHEPWACPSTQ